MAKVLIDGEWYEEIGDTCMEEVQFETIFLHHAIHLYPDCHVVPFKREIDSAFGKAKADAIIIDKHYTGWWVVEIEIAPHDLYRHVEPQVQRLAQGNYDEAHVKYLCQKHLLLDYDKLLQLMRSTPAKVIVVVNSPKPNWVEPLAAHGAAVNIFQLLRSAHGRDIYRFNGAEIVLPVTVISLCSLDKILPRSLRIEDPSTLVVPSDNKISISYNGQITDWKWLNPVDRGCLTSIGRYPLDSNYRRRYELFRFRNGKLGIRPKKR